MQSLVNNLEILRCFLWEMPEETDAQKRHKQAAIDVWIECNAVAEILPEVTLTLPAALSNAAEREPPEPIAHLRPAYGPGSITDAATYERKPK